MDVDTDFDAFVSARSLALTRLALALTGNRAEAEDLVQSALLKAYRHWGKVVRADHPEAYVRRIIVTTHVDAVRRRRLHLFRERPVADVPEPPPSGHGSDPAHLVSEADALARALRGLPPRPRAVLVLRHYVGLDDDAIAAELGCSAGSVRAYASKGAAALRVVLTASPEETAAAQPGTRTRGGRP